MVKNRVSARRASPLAGLDGPAGGVVLEERAFLGKLDLRGDAARPGFLDGVQGCLGLELPLTPNTTTRTGEHTIFWLGPDEWLVHTPEDEQGELATRLREYLNGHASAVTDVSDYYVVLRLSGPQARTLLAKGCPLDLHPRSFGVGDCAQSLYAKAAILLHQVDAAPTFDIQVRWSFAQYLWRYLADGAREFSEPV